MFVQRPIAREIIICATQTHYVLEEKGRRTREAASIETIWSPMKQEYLTQSSENRAHCAAQAESAR